MAEFDAVSDLACPVTLATVSTRQDQTAPPADTISSPSAPSSPRFIGGLPIEVPGNTTLYVLQIYPAKDQLPWFFQVPNSGSERSFWPEQNMKPEQALGFITRCDVINLGQAAVINVTLDFALQYKREVQDVNHPKQTTAGPTIATGIRRAVIGLLQPNTPFTFYIVNQSLFFVDATPPTTASVQMLGESTAQTVTLVRPQASFEDLLALGLSFFPSRYPWKGLPDAVLH